MRANKSATDLITRFERMNALFRDAGITDSAMPARTFVFSLEADFRRYRDDRASAGFYKGGAARDYIARSTPRPTTLPRRDCMNTCTWCCGDRPSRFRTGSKKAPRISIRPPISRARRFIWANALMGTSICSCTTNRCRGRRYSLNDEVARHAKASLTTYYAESWALVHMLNLAPAWRDGMPKFILDLAAGRDADSACSQAAFRQSRYWTTAIAALPAYLDAMRPVTVATTPFDPPKPAVEKLSPLDSAIARADLEGWCTSGNRIWLAS